MTFLSNILPRIITSRSLSTSYSILSRSIANLPAIRTLSAVAEIDYYTPITRYDSNDTVIMSDSFDAGQLEIEELHNAALLAGRTTYKDPDTGFTVFTELAHLKRGTCCGNMCRHCPYGYENVKNEAWRRPAKVRSGDRPAAKAIVESIFNGHIPTETFDLDSGASTTASSSQPLHASRSNGTSVTPTTNGSSASVSAKKLARAFSTTSKNLPYTRGGDGGTSQLLNGERRSKDDANFEALGTVDELCSVVGVVHALLDEPEKYGALPDQLLDVMSRIFDVGSHVAKPREPGTKDFTANGIGDGFDGQHVQDLELWINEMTEELPELTSFILPTGAKAAAHLHVARTVCRRAERRMIPLAMDHKTCDPNALRYLNRLSDYFFTAARWVNYCEDLPEIQYQRETPQTTQRQRVTRSLQYEDDNSKS